MPTWTAEGVANTSVLDEIARAIRADGSDEAKHLRLKLDDRKRSPFTVDKRGYFRNGSSLFIPVGVNYWPASSGARLWYQDEFPAAEVERDFAALQKTGFNAVRIFLTWPCFEPREGEFDAARFGDLLRMLAMARDAELAVDVSVFVGGMSGAFYWPDWVTANIYSDPTAVSQTRAFALHVARTVAPFADSIFALELGNEMNNVETGVNCAPPQVADPDLRVDQIVAWTATIVAALQEGIPGVPVVPGTGDGAIHADTGWTLGDAAHKPIAGTVLNFHPYAVLFDPTHGDGLLDPLTHAVSAYAAAFVRAHGPAFMQEWGTLLTSGKAQQDGYLRGVLPTAFAQVSATACCRRLLLPGCVFALMALRGTGCQWFSLVVHAGLHKHPGPALQHAREGIAPRAFRRRVGHGQAWP